VTPPWRLLGTPGTEARGQAAGLVLDTNVLILAERRVGDRTTRPDFSPGSAYGQVSISAATASELLVGVHRAAGEARRIQRSAFVEATLAAMPILDVNLEAARVHARIKAALQARGQTLGANDLVIAATAPAGGHAALTTDVDDFGRAPGPEVLAFPLAA